MGHPLDGRSRKGDRQSAVTVMSPKKPAIEIAESVMGTWHYHLRKSGSNRALCGAQVMHSARPLERWNVKIPNHHIPESFCTECDDSYDGRLVKL